MSDCNGKQVGQGFCSKHYQRLRNHGDPYYVYVKPILICEISDCNDKQVGRGYCKKHWQRWRKYGDPNIVKAIWNKHPTGICDITDCNFKVVARGFCAKHYMRLQNHGDPNFVKPVWNKRPVDVCEISDCNGKHLAQGFCNKHYSRWKKHGNPKAVHKSLKHLEGSETYVYRLYDLNNNLLYIGITYDIKMRFYHHSKDKYWWPDVSKKYIRKYPNRQEAVRIEKQAIEKYNPLYNEQYNQKENE